MEFKHILTVTVILFAVVAATGILTSRGAIEKLVGAGVLPRVFLNFIPILTIAARALGLVLFSMGLVQVGIDTGVLSSSWLSRYGFSSLLIILGVLLVLMTFRRNRVG